MKFQPKTEREIAEAGLWPKGDYQFEILEAEETTSNSGNEMIKMKVKVYNDQGRSQNIFDYIVAGVMEHKLRHLCEAAGLLAEYEQGEIEAYQLVGKTGYCKVGISKDKSGQYADRNGITDYLVDTPVDAAKVAGEKLKDDSIPW